MYSVGDVARALEHHVLEEVSEAGLAGALALGPTLYITSTATTGVE